MLSKICQFGKSSFSASSCYKPNAWLIFKEDWESKSSTKASAQYGNFQEGESDVYRNLMASPFAHAPPLQ